MLSRGSVEDSVASKPRDDVLPLSRAHPHWLRRRPSSRDWAVVLPTFLTVCVLAYAGHQATARSSRADVAAVDATPPLRTAISPHVELPISRSPLPSVAARERKALGEPVTALADVITLTNPIVSALVLSETGPVLPEALARRTSRDLSRGEDVIEVQGRLADLGFMSVRPTGMWGPLSNQALQAFKEANELPPATGLDEATEQVLFGPGAKGAPLFVGIWATDVRGCSKRAKQHGLLQTVIAVGGARAGETHCSFNRKRQVGDAWSIAATCRDGHDRWAANIQLVVNGGRLTWTSERGTQSYLKCGAALGTLAYAGSAPGLPRTRAGDAR